jgi:hypothetical protein
MGITASTHRVRAGGAGLRTPAAGNLTTLVHKTRWAGESHEVMWLPRFTTAMRTRRWTRCCVASSAARATFPRQ